MTLPAFYPILDTAILDRRGLPLASAAVALLDAGARILQIRHKGHFSRELFSDAREIAALCRESGALLVINDRADIASFLGAGVHLGQDDLSPADARKVVPEVSIVGFSTHNAAQLESANAEPVDYVALGPMFNTGSKDNPDPVLGMEELRRLRPKTNHPLVAIGGVTRANASQALAAGADSLAVIADLMLEVDTAAALRRRAREWLSVVQG